VSAVNTGPSSVGVGPQILCWGRRSLRAPASVGPHPTRRL